MTFDIRFAAYEPDGDRLGILHYCTQTSTGLPLNDKPSLDLSYVRGTPGSEWLEDFVEVAMEWSSGDEWIEPPNGRFIKMSWSGDHLDETKSLKLTMPGYSWLLQTGEVRPKEGEMDDDGNRVFYDATVGQILGTLLSEAQGRGCFPGMSWDISDASDSDGEPWAKRVNLAYKPGLSLDQVLKSMADQRLVDWNFWDRELHVYNADTLLARDLTEGDNPVSLRSGYDVGAAPDRGDASGLIHRALVRGEDGLRVEIDNPSAVSPWGEFEKTLDQGGVSDEGTAILLAEGALREGERERVEMTRTLLFAGRWLPWRDYRPGDWVYAPGAGGQKQRVRVRQLTLTKNADGIVQGNAVLNDRFIEASLKTAQQIKGITGGASVGGGTGTIPQPELPDDIGQDKRQPSAPTGIIATSEGYIDASGIPRSIIRVEWTPVTTATDGTDMEMRRYEVWGQLPTRDDRWRNIMTVGGDETVGIDTPYNPGDVWNLKVQGIGELSTIPGEYSEVHQLEMADDTIPPPAPSAPILSSRLGTVRVQWDGETFEGEGMPRDLSHVEAHLSSTADFTPTPATLVDTYPGERALTVLSDQPYNTDIHVAFVAVDRSGNSSDPSDVSTIQVTPLVDTDIIGEIIDGENIVDGSVTASDKIVGNSITGELVQALAIEAGHIASNAITADKIDAGAITAEKLQLGAVAPQNLAGAGVNHVTSPSFEDATFWAAVANDETAIDQSGMVGTWDTVQVSSQSGGRSARCQITSTSVQQFYITPEMPLPPSRRVYVSGWFRHGTGGSAPDSGATGYMALRLTHHDGEIEYYVYTITPDPSGSWQFGEQVGVLPETVVSYSAYLRVLGQDAAGGTVYFDDVCVQDVVGSSDDSRVQIDPSGMRVFTGGTERIRIDPDGFASWNDDGERTVNIGSSGYATLTGTFRTNFGSPRVEIRETGLQSPAIYFYPEEAAENWNVVPNILAWVDDATDSNSIYINAGQQDVNDPVNQIRLHQYGGEFWIGNRTQGFPMAYAQRDGAWAFGINGGDNEGETKAAVRSDAHGAWSLGANPSTIRTRVRGGADASWWLGPTRTANTAAVNAESDGAWYLGVSNTNHATPFVRGYADGRWWIGTQTASRIFGQAGTGGETYVYGGGSIFLNSGSNINLNTSAGGAVYINGAVVAPNKSFRIPHPLKEGMDLVHGCTESHVHGVEYWGIDELGEDGIAVVDLPAYFETLTKPGGRSVILTPSGVPYPIGADEIQDGHFVARGEPGRRFSWLVKAERGGYDFEVEQPARDREGVGDGPEPAANNRNHNMEN